MTTTVWKDLGFYTEIPFDPNADVVDFTGSGVSAGQVFIDGDDHNNKGFGLFNNSGVLILHLPFPERFHSSNFIFDDGGVVIVGDNSSTRFDDDLNNTLAGSGGSDFLTGLGGSDSISAGGGNDVIWGHGGDQNAWFGNDIIDGGAGFDIYQLSPVDNDAVITGSLTTGIVIVGGSINTVHVSNIEGLISGNRNDSLDGSAGNDYLDGGGGNDILHGLAGADTLRGSDGDDLVDGGDGNDFLRGNGGRDTLNGGLGDDLIVAARGSDAVDGGAGTDEVRDWTGINASTYTNVERIVLQDSAIFNTQHIGASSNLIGNAGNNLFIGNSASTHFIGAMGNDTLSVGAGNDTFEGHGQLDQIDFNGFSGAVTVTFTSQGAGTISSATTGTDSFSGIEQVAGGTANDLLTGGAGNERLRGHEGNDTLNGGGGSADWATYFDSPNGIAVNIGADSISVDLDHNDTTPDDTLLGNRAFDGFDQSTLAGVQHYTDTLIDIENVLGGRGDDTIIGSDGDNVLQGYAGNDIFASGKGNDTIDGYRPGNDNDMRSLPPIADGNMNQVYYGFATQGIVADLGAHTVDKGVGNGTDTLFNIQSVIGSEFADSIVGGGDADHVFTGSLRTDPLEVLEGGDGDDTIDGGDTIVGHNDVLSWRDQTPEDGIVVNMGPGTLTFSHPAYAQITLAGGHALDGYGHTDTFFNIDGVWGTNNADLLVGGSGSQRYEPLSGNTPVDFEFFAGAGGDDTIDGGAGIDRVQYDVPGSSQAVSVNLNLDMASNDGFGNVDTLFNIEQVRGSNNFQGDTLVGNDGDNTFDGGAGNDIIDGGLGTDAVDYRRSQLGVSVNLQNGTAIDGWDSSSATPGLQPFTDTLFNIENAIGSDFSDTFVGRAGFDNIFDGRGITRVDPSYFYSQNGIGVYTDEINYSAAATQVVVNLGEDDLVVGGHTIVGGTALDQGNGATNGVDTLIDIERFLGGAGNDVFVGSDGSQNAQGLLTDQSETWRGNAGNDTINGGSNSWGDFDIADYGNSTIGIDVNLGAGTASDGFGGTDTLINIDGVNGGSGGDFIMGGSDSRSLSGGRFEVFSGGAGNDTIYGSQQDFFGGGNGSSSDFDMVNYQGTTGGVFANLSSHSVTMGGKTVNSFTVDATQDFHVNGIQQGIDQVFGMDGVRGGQGNDTFVGGDNGPREVWEPNGGVDQINGDNGYDILSYRAAPQGVYVDLGHQFALDGWGNVDSFSGIEGVQGGDFNDTLIGGGIDDDDPSNWEEFEGRAGDDYIDGGDTVDLVRLDSVNNKLDAVAYRGAPTAVLVDMSQDTSTVNDGYGGTDTLVGIEIAIGSSYDDTLIGGNVHHDRIEGYEGRAGNDSIVGGSGNDYVFHDDSPYGVKVDLSLGRTLDDGWGVGTSDTLVGIENAVGSRHDDTLIGNSGDNELIGQDGSDMLRGGGGNDTLIGDNDNQQGSVNIADYSTNGVGESVTVNLTTGIANDGLGGTDLLSRIDGAEGGAGDDTLIGNDDANYFVGAAGNDLIDGRDGVDWVNYGSDPAGINANLATGVVQDGFGGVDQLVSIEGIVGSDFSDTLIGSNGDDRFDSGKGNDLIVGGAGFDRVRYSAADGPLTITGGATNGDFTVTGAFGTDTLSGIEAIVGGELNDSIHGSSVGAGQREFFGGGGGNDTIIGDTVGGGQTVLSFNNIDHGFFINIGADDTLTGSAKVDYQYFDASGTNYVHFSGIDGVVGGTLSDSLTGGSRNEFFQGNQGSDTIDGNGGVDTVSYSLSTDAVIVNLSGNTQTVNYLNLDGFRIGNANDSLGNDVVTLGGGQAFDGYNTDPDNNDIFNSTDFLSHIENVEGSDFADTMFGNGSNNRLSGGDGNDWFAAGGGNDVFIGGDGFDQVNFRNSTAAGVGVNVDLASGVANKGVNGADSLSGIEDVNGTDFNDTLKGSDVLPWSGLFRPGFFTSQENFTGRMGSDTIDGGGTANGQNDSVNYGPATAGVTVNLGTGVASDGQGGTDKLLNIDQVLGSNFADVLTGGSQSRDFGGGLFESFRGGIGADTIDGKDGQDRVEYQANASGPVIINLGTSAQVVANSAYGAVTIGGGRAIDGADSVFTPGQDSAVGGVQPSIDVLINIEQVRGTQFSDIMFGGGGAQNAGTIYDHETFEGLEGNDTINGLGGIDFASYQQSVGAVDVNLATGVGRDGYGTTDVLINIEGVVGSDFGDKLTGGDGDNIFRGGGGADTIDGGLGNNRALYNLSPGAVNVLLGDGTLAGSASDGYGNVDTLISINQVLGSVFNDTIMGAGGNDTLEGDAGNDVLDGAGGINTVSYTRATAGVTVDLGADTAFGGAGNDALANFTNVIGGAGNDLITGDANDNVFEGGAGNDTLAGGGGNDTLVYTNSASGVSVNLGAAAVVVGTGVGAVTLAGGHALDGYDRDTLTGGVQSSVDTFTSIEKFTGSNFVDTLYTDQNFSLQGSAGFENLTLTGTGSIDGTGNALNNAIIGNAGNNVLDGGAGADTLTGGAGNDIYRLDSLGDVVVETVGGNDTIILTQSYLDAASIAVLAHPFSFDLNATGRTGIETVTVDDAAGVKITVVGNALANFLVGNLDANTLSGGAGNDTLDGNGGANSLIGGAGDDLFRVRNSLDIVKEDDNAGIDTVESFVASYKLTAGVENLRLLNNGIAVIGRGNALNNKITGNDSDNSLFGDLGNDTLEGGAGNDKLFGGAGSDSYILSGNDQIIEVGGSAADQALIAVTADLSYNSQLEVLRADTLHGANSGIGITGGKASEDIIGGGGSDTLNGGTGTNTLEGGAGNDVYVLGSSGDTIVETGSGIDEVQADFSIDLAKLGSIENVTLLGTGNINALGNALANRIVGNDANNLLTGAGGNDTMDGAGGNDTMDGGAGDDTLEGGAGSNTVSYASATTAVTVNLATHAAGGGAGTDVLSNFENILGGAGADSLTGDSNDNVIDGGLGSDTMVGGAGNDTYVVSVAGVAGDVINESTLVGGGTDTVRTGLASYTLQAGLENLTETGTAAANLVGNTADNVITGGAGADTLAGGAGNDTLVGNAGNDTYVLEGADVIVEDSIGGGIDTVRTTENAPATLAENLENFILLATNGVNATGNTSNNNILVQGGTGNDTLDGGTGSDTLTGGAGNDTYLVDAQADTIVETATAAGGVDTVIASVSYSIAANAAIENLIASGSAVINLTGNAGNNHLTGNANANVLDGGAGNDTLAGGDGNDLYIVSTGDVINVDSDGTDLVRAASNWTLVGGLDNLELTGTAAIGVGNELDNRLTGTAAANTLDGGIGDDTLVGLEGNDSYIVDSLDDTIIDSAGVDTVLTALASYTLQTGLENLAAATGGPAASLTGNAANNVITGGTGSDTLSGLAGADTLNGGNGDDRLDGGAGIDSMVGGAGNDTYVVDVVGDAVNESTLVGGGIDTVIASINYTLGAGLENLVLAVGTANLAGTGNTLDNALTGNAGNNLLSGLAGSDTLSGGIGNDTIDGGAGNDTLDGGEGSSTLETDTVSYASATTAVNVDLAAGTASGTGTGTDTLLHFENVLGGAGADSITGNGNANLLDGGLGIDTMAGGDGNDTYMVNVAGDVVAETLDGGTADTVVSQVNYALGANVENLVLGGTAANGTGNELNNRITGNAAANTLMGAVGDDTLIGGAGADSLNGGVGGSDWASYEDSAASVIVNLNLTGTTVFGVAAHTGNVGGVLDVLTDIENARGGSGADTLVAAAGGSALDGGAGNDLLRGGAGNDILMGGDGNADWADFANLGAGNDVMADLGNSMAGGIGVGSDTLSGIENLRGGAGNDTLVGDDGNNILEGGLGSDSLVGGGGIDWAILGGTTAWIADLQDAHTAMTIGGQVDTLEGIENLLGGSGNDILTGNDDANWLDGAAGNDILTGGLGNDTYVVDVAGDRVIEDGDNVGIDTVRSAVSINLTVAGVVVSTSLDLIENVTLTGTAVASAIGNTLDNVLTGNSAANTLSGGIGSDTLDGGAGADSMAGGADDDTYYVDVAGDVVTESTLPGGGTDTVIVSTSVVNFSYTLGAGLENLTLLGSGSLAGTGNTQDNVLTGNAGANTLNGGAGADTLIGGNGNDVYGVDNSGDVVQETGNGIDRIESSVNVSLAASHPNWIGEDAIENVTLTGTASVAAIGNTLDNVLTGNAGANTLNGGAGNDTMIGGAGNDTYVVDSAGDVVNETLGGGGTADTVSASISYTLGAGLENLLLTLTGNIDGTGNELNNLITGNTWDNVLTGNAGADTLDGGGTLGGGGLTGEDTLIGGAGDDVYEIDSEGDVIVEAVAAGTDRVRSMISFTLTDNLEQLELLDGGSALYGIGNAAANLILGNAAANSLDGGAGADTLTGGAGDDTLNGGAGIDSMTGGAGNDFYVVDVAGDVVNETIAGNSGFDTVDSQVSYSLGTNVEALILEGTGNLTGTGNTLDNVLTGNSGANTLLGGLGNDTLDGGAGNDSLDGGAGADTMIGGAGNDTFIFDNAGDSASEENGGGTDTVVSSVTATLADNVENLTLSGTAALLGTGNTLDNVLTGNSGANTLDGGAGNDTLIGGAGNDKLRGGDGDDTFVYDAADVAPDAVIGGAGQDTMLVTDKTGVTIDLTSVASAGRYDGIEHWDISGPANVNNTLNLSVEGVHTMLGSDIGTLVVDGNYNDVVNAVGQGWEVVQVIAPDHPEDPGATYYYLYNYNNAGLDLSLQLDYDMTLNVS